MSNEKQIEQEIQDKGLNAPRLTPDHIDSIIVDQYYFTAANAQWGADPNTTALIGMHKQLETLILKLVKRLLTRMHVKKFGC